MNEGVAVLFLLAGTHQVIVDVREFRSSLPSLLHKRGMQILPLTLEVHVYTCIYVCTCKSVLLPGLFSTF